MSRERERITIEYPINCTASSLFGRMSTPIGLGCWFADKVEQEGNVFTLFWHKTPVKAKLLRIKENKYVIFRWEDDFDTSYFFEFSIETSELTGGVTLYITDFVEPSEREDSVSMWDACVKRLRGSLGAV